MSSNPHVVDKNQRPPAWAHAPISLEAVSIVSPQVTRAIQIAVFGDTHNRHHTIETPPKCDIAIHVGDFTALGTRSEILSFIEWIKKTYGETPIVVIDGNHERFKHRAYHQTSFDPLKAPCRQEIKESLFRNAGIHYLMTGESVKLFGLTISGVPWENDGEPVYENMSLAPETNIIISHIPPKGFLDRVEALYESVGSAALAQKAMELPDLSACFFGHAHLARGVQEMPRANGSRVFFINAAMAGGPGYSERPSEPLADCILVKILPLSA